MRQLIVGTTNEIIDESGAYAELGMDEIALDMHLGIPRHADVMASMERFPADVMPRFRADRASAG